jgi:amino acid adenylation domain-containing protein
MRSSAQSRPHAVELNGMVLGGRLRLEWTYSEGAHRRERVQAWAAAVERAIGRLIAHCQSEGAGGVTPSDFPLAQLSQDELDRLVGDGRAVQDVYPLSPMQEGILFHALYEPESGAYVNQLSCRLEGEVDARRFAQAWQDVVDRHEALRTSFAWKGVSRPVQVVAKHAQVPFTEIDLRGLDAAAQRAKIDALLDEDRRRGFPLDRAPLLRVMLLRLGERTHQFVWTHQHLILDGWCVPIVFQHVLQRYGGVATIGRTRSTYRDYIAWLGRQDRGAAERYWRGQLAGVDEPTSVRVPRATSGAVPAGTAALRLSPEATETLKRWAMQEQLTLSTLVQGAWAVLLQRYSDRDEVVFGVTVSGRPAEIPGVESSIGLFINTLPVRVRPSHDAQVADWLRELQAAQLERDVFSYCKLTDIQGWSAIPRGTPLFDSIVVFENYPVEDSLEGDLSGVRVAEVQSVEQTDLGLTLTAAPGPQLLLKLAYDGARFDEPAAASMLRHLANLVQAFASAGAAPVARVPMLDPAERDRLIVGWNATARRFDGDLTAEIERRAALDGDRIAVVSDGAQVSYRELNRRANELGRRLVARGVRPGARVGVCAERSVEMVVALLGVWKAGAAYVPFDPTYPADRLRLMVAETQLAAVVADRSHAVEAAAFGATVVVIEEEEGKGGENLGLAVAELGEAYVIYTSGSTGRPKGVRIPHHALANHMAWMQHAHPLAVDDRVLQKTAISFDASVWEFWAPLAAGATLVMAAPEAHRAPGLLVEELRRHQVTVLQVVPTMLRALVGEPGFAACGTLRRVFAGGEALTPDLVTAFRAVSRAELVNLYGPTEVTIDSVTWRCTDADLAGATVPIGRPVANTQAYVLDRGGALAPPGVPGELYLGGAQVGLGYVGRADLTAERFVPDPFGPPGARLYRTGDLCRWRPDGTVEYLGRIDHQVKLRGFRIELGEIESVLAECPGVREAVAMVREDVPGAQRLVAYWLRDQAAAVPEMREFLRSRLPEYMVPALFIEMEAWPLTPNGKIDRRAFPAADAREAAAYEAPTTEREKVLAEIWEDVLGVERVGLRDSFFELGGHSLTTVQMINRVEERLKVSPAIRDLFQHPTLAEFAANLPVPAEDEMLAALLDEVEGLSDEQVASLLRQRKDQP